MRVEEIALRQEIRQMLNEAGINRETLREMTQNAIKEEVDKQVKFKLSQTNIMSMVSLNKYVSCVTKDCIFLKSDVFISLIFLPPIVIDPLSTSQNLIRSFNKVDLPQPLFPYIPIMVFFFISILKSSKITSSS